jgi:hypothetical protein
MLRLFGLTLLLIFSFTPIASAQVVLASNAEIELVNKTLINDEKLATKECQVARMRLNAKAERVAITGTDRVEKYQTIIKRLNNIIEIAKEQEIGVQGLSDSVLNLGNKLSEFQTLNTKYQVSLQNTANVSCLDEDDSFEDKLSQSRKDLISAKQAADDLKKSIDSVKSELLLVRGAIGESQE